MTGLRAILVGCGGMGNNHPVGQPEGMGQHQAARVAG